MMAMTTSSSISVKPVLRCGMFDSFQRVERPDGNIKSDVNNPFLPEHDDKMTVLSSSPILREPQTDACSSARLALDLDRAAMQLGDALDDRQPQPDAAAGRRARAIGTIKALEDM